MRDAQLGRTYTLVLQKQESTLSLLSFIGETALVGPKTEPADTPFETPAPTSPLRPIKAEEHYLRRQLSQSHRAITEDISLLMAEGDKYWYGLKCCTTIIVTILIAILLLVILRWVLYK